MKLIIECTEQTYSECKKISGLSETAFVIANGVPYLQGEWIKHIDNLFPEESTEECSICHEEQFLNRGNDDNFCPNCGADMRKGGDSDEDS